jgi:hypothetical protein
LFCACEIIQLFCACEIIQLFYACEIIQLFCACEIIQLFRACEIIQLFSLVCFFGAVRKFYFRCVINKNTTSYIDRDSCLCQDLCLLPTAVSYVKGLYPRSAGRPHSLA